MTLFDAHCHLDQLDDPAAALERAVEAGVERILAVSEDAASGRAALQLKREFPERVLAGVGLHPAILFELSAEELDENRRFVEERIGEADVLGEVGLDHKHAQDDEQKRFQEELLERLLVVAADAGKPINLHSRRAQRRVMEIAIRYTKETGLPALLHWFTASKKLIRLCGPEGVYVSVGPSVLFDGPAREVCVEIPEHLLLVETDSPVPYGGEPAEPAWAARVVERLAELRGVTAERLADRLAENFSTYLRE